MILFNSSILALMLMFTSVMSEVEFYRLGELGKTVLNRACSVLVGTVGTGACNTEYLEKVSPLYSIQESSPTDVKIRGTLTYCCAVGALRTCILNSIKDSCGDDAEFQSRKIVDEILSYKAGVEKQKDTCGGDEILFMKESPLCWPEPAQYTAIFIGILLIMFCFCGCLARFCRSR